MIRFENVTKAYPRSARPALDDISLEIVRGQFVFVVGPSGSGKSTMLRLVIREEPTSSGSVLVAGNDLGLLPPRKVPRLRRQIGTVFQDFRLLPNKNVTQNVAFALQVLGRPNRVIKTLVPETLELVGLQGKGRRMPHELSGGEQQRVAIARAVVNKPAILLADIVRLLASINKQYGTTVVMATHDNVIVDELQRRVIELENGVVVRDEEQGTYVPRAESPVAHPAPGHEHPADLWTNPDADWAEEHVRGED